MQHFLHYHDRTKEKDTNNQSTNNEDKPIRTIYTCRKKEDRQKLETQTCPNCADWFEAGPSADTGRAARLQRHGKHRCNQPTQRKLSDADRQF